MFEENVWRMPSAAAAKTVYQTLLKQFLDTKPAEWSLVSGFFQQQPVLAFLWDPIRNAAMAKAVEQAATDAGGQEMAEDAKTALLSQLLARRLGVCRGNETRVRR